jgi:hypothetical protein
VWYQQFATFLRQFGFVASTSDTSLFVYKEGAQIAYLLYVDDIILTASSSALLQHIMAKLATRSTDGLFLSQRQYVVDLLQQASIAECHSTATPIDTHDKLSASNGALLFAADGSHYRSTVGAL